MHSTMGLVDVIDRIKSVPFQGKRRVIAIAGSPASGKSTLSEAIIRAFPNSQILPMDGFHLDNKVLREQGLLLRKGAPQTFDVVGFKHLVGRLKQENDLYIPTFDRALDRSIGGAGHISSNVDTVIVEGNYLLLDQPGWRDLKPFWDMSIALATSSDVLRARLIERWLDYGYTPQEAREKVEENDLPNAELVQKFGTTADLTLSHIEGLAR
ncbi:MAG: nucleoside/nucleotide kinase family protein [Litoreibacter sp.]